jgi:putative membrane protein
MDHMVADHKKDVKEFEHAAKSDRQNEIQQFAAETLPTLREHLALAQSAQAEARNEARSGSKSAAGQKSDVATK